MRTQDTDLPDEPVHVHKFCPSVSKTRCRSRSFFTECCFRVRVSVDTNPNPNLTLTLNQHSIKKDRPLPRVYLLTHFALEFYGDVLL